MDNNKYLNKVTSQHKTKQKFMSWINANLTTVDGITRLLLDLDYHFDIYNARGKQQDIIGDIEGVSRILDFQPADGSSPVLEDDMYKTLQLAKISINQWDGTIPGAVELWKNLFPDYQIIIQDNQDMSMNLSVIGLESSLEKELISKGYIAPKPEGVRIHYDFYIHLYQAEQTAYFAAEAVLSSHYTIDGKAIVAQDTIINTNEVIGTSQAIISHIKINGMADTGDIITQSNQIHGAVTRNINHYIID